MNSHPYDEEVVLKMNDSMCSLSSAAAPLLDKR
jgi:hypothetical protein